MGSKKATTTEPRFTIRCNYARGNVHKSASDRFALWSRSSMAWWAYAPRMGETPDDDQACFGCCSGRHLLCIGDGQAGGIRRRLSVASHHHGGAAGAGWLD